MVSHTYKGFSRIEAAFGLFWLGLGALISLALEVIYLTTWITLPGGRAVVFPFTIIIALLFNQILSKTARLWSKNRLVAAIPLLVWLVGFFVFSVSGSVKGDVLIGSDLRGILLLFAGFFGGSWPLTRKQ